MIVYDEKHTKRSDDEARVRHNQREPIVGSRSDAVTSYSEKSKITAVNTTKKYRISLMIWKWVGLQGKRSEVQYSMKPSSIDLNRLY